MDRDLYVGQPNLGLSNNLPEILRFKAISKANHKVEKIKKKYVLYKVASPFIH